MSKQIALGLLSVTNTGSEILSVLDVIQSSIADADNDRGQDSAFMDDAFGGWCDCVKLTTKRGDFSPFCALIHKDYAFFILKKVF